MKQSVVKDLEEIVKKIQDENFSSSDIRSLLISLRYAHPRSPILKELGDFVAHPDERNTGISHAHINKFMSRFIKFATSGGSVRVGPPPFNQTEILSELIKTIKSNRISGFIEAKFKSHSFKIMSMILNIVAGTKIENDKVPNCRLSEVEKTDRGFIVYFCFGPVKGRVITVNGEVRIPAFIATDS